MADATNASDLAHWRTLNTLARAVADAITAASRDGLEVDVSFEVVSTDLTHLNTPGTCRVFELQTAANVRVLRPIEGDLRGAVRLG